MPFLPLFTGIRHLVHVLAVPPTKACLLCATPAGMDLYIQAMPVGTYRVQFPEFSEDRLLLVFVREQRTPRTETWEDTAPVS